MIPEQIREKRRRRKRNSQQQRRHLLKPPVASHLDTLPHPDPSLMHRGFKDLAKGLLKASVPSATNVVSHMERLGNLPVAPPRGRLELALRRRLKLPAHFMPRRKGALKVPSVTSHTHCPCGGGTGSGSACSCSCGRHHSAGDACEVCNSVWWQRRVEPLFKGRANKTK